MRMHLEVSNENSDTKFPRVPSPLMNKFGIAKNVSKLLFPAKYFLLSKFAKRIRRVKELWEMDNPQKTFQS